jgi:D-tyrosyl-tRNA(Tyr) deacylase
MRADSSSVVTEECLVVISEVDPVAVRVAERWGTLEATEWKVEGGVVRRLSPGVTVLRRDRPHIHDERLDERLPASLRNDRPTIVFPSIHRSEQNVPCLTVHPLGNPGSTSEVGGRPDTWVPADPRRMTAALRALAAEAPAIGLRASFEATHHGPELSLPAFFVEIGFGTAGTPPADAVRLLARVISGLEPDASDRVALGIGGGHYAPHFTDLALRRRWAFGHLISRHALAGLSAGSARSAYAASGGPEGILYARAEDAARADLAALGPRLRDQDAPRRVSVPPTDGARPASGT